ncbi:MAG: hypothetical protein M0D55_01805 [Elusimicrobiota bacterium]|nr:MAG: hypothetical protein M0D55_01805 [Elusimicrobiota bacterium]
MIAHALVLVVLSAAHAEPEPNKEAWDKVTKAFAAGEPIPEATFKDAELTVYQLIKKVSEGCAQPCQNEKYLKNIALIARVRKLPDIPKIQAVYCPGTPAVCRARASVVANAGGRGAVPPKPAPVARAQAAVERAKKTGDAIAGGLAQEKTDDLPGPAAEEELDPSFDEVRDESAVQVSGSAVAALKGLPGGKARDLAARLERADKTGDAAARRAALTEADRGFTALLDKELAREAAAARAAACAAKKESSASAAWPPRRRPRSSTRRGRRPSTRTRPSACTSSRAPSTSSRSRRRWPRATCRPAPASSPGSSARASPRARRSRCRPTRTTRPPAGPEGCRSSA